MRSWFSYTLQKSVLMGHSWYFDHAIEKVNSAFTRKINLNTSIIKLPLIGSVLKVKVLSSCQFITVVLQSSETQGQSVSRVGRKGAQGLFRLCLKTSFLARTVFFSRTRPTASGSPGEDEVNRECLLLSLVPVVLCGLCGWAYTGNVY